MGTAQDKEITMQNSWAPVLLFVSLALLTPLVVNGQTCTVVGVGSKNSGRCAHIGHVCSPVDDASGVSKGKCRTQGGAGEYECSCVGNASSGTPPATPTPLGPAPAAFPLGPARTFTYGGGDILSAAKIVVVYWGAQPPGQIAALDSFYARITQSGYFLALGEYNAGPPTFVGSFAIEPNDSRVEVDTVTIAAEIEQQIFLQALPAPDLETLYVVHFGDSTIPALGANLPTTPGLPLPSQPIVIGAKPGSFCSYHFTARHQIPFLGPLLLKGPKLRIAVIAEGSIVAGCAPVHAPNTPFNAATASASHEIVETITDPDDVVLGLGLPPSLQCGNVVLPPLLDIPDSPLSWTSNVSAFCSPDEIADPCVDAPYGTDPALPPEDVTQIFSRSTKMCDAKPTSVPTDNSAAGRHRSCLLDCASSRHDCSVGAGKVGGNACTAAYNTCASKC
jgi:hypothetical protein